MNIELHNNQNTDEFTKANSDSECEDSFMSCDENSSKNSSEMQNNLTDNMSQLGIMEEEQKTINSNNEEE